ncbi:MAG: hypothetical protein JWO99_825 [Candidatus Saccharibacteria bacterium]|nr:hypothetical protein [Candidatus Saccharibacteria bacterium]
MNILSSALGHYEAVGRATDADIIVGNSFGTSIHPESPNAAIARFILANEQGQPIVVDRTLADAFPKSTQLDVVVDGAVSNTIGSVGGSWGILVEAKKYMDEVELSRPLMAAQAFHVGRVAMQAEKLGMTGIIVPEGLPTSFDRASDQIWTRSQVLWVPREVLGSAALKAQGKL